MAKVWAFFDQVAARYGTPWPVRSRLPQQDRLVILRALGVRMFAPLVYVADRVVLGTDFPNVPTQLRAKAGWVAADDRLSVDFLQAVLRDTPADCCGDE